MTLESGFYLEFSGFFVVFLDRIRPGTDSNKSTQIQMELGTLYQTNILFSKFHRSMPEKNANYCYSYLSKKVCRNEAITTLQLGDVAFPKQLDELYSVHIPTVSGEGVSVDIVNGHLIRCMLEDSEKGLWSEKSVSQQKFGLKKCDGVPYKQFNTCYSSVIYSYTLT